MRFEGIKTKRYMTTILVIITLMGIPALGMFFSEDVKWSLIDFILLALILSIFFYFYYTIVDNYQKGKKFFLIGLLSASLIIIWIELAVGLFNLPFSGS